jgi:flagellar basal-body rod protein FlgF
MDKMLYIAASGAKQTMLKQATTSNNLANASTTGFRSDFAQARAMPAFGYGQPSRVFSMTEKPGVDFNQGAYISTGNDFDFAIKGEGWISVQPADGFEAFTRRGDLVINANGALMNGAGYPVYGNGGPISIPPFEKIDIGADGSISIQPFGAPESAIEVVDRIKLVNPPLNEIEKGNDGLFRRIDETLEIPDASVTISQGALENSNVNVINELTNMIQSSRSFELHIKLMKEAEENDASLTKLIE